jgi:hypothetical protein
LPKTHTYTVKGSWPFPLDMLRRDQSCAATPADQEKIDRLSGERSRPREDFKDVEITLTGPNPPLTARWESFGWSVPTDLEYTFLKELDQRRRDEDNLVAAGLAKLDPAEREAITARMKGQFA